MGATCATRPTASSDSFEDLSTKWSAVQSTLLAVDTVYHGQLSTVDSLQCTVQKLHTVDNSAGFPLHLEKTGPDLENLGK